MIEGSIEEAAMNTGEAGEISRNIEGEIGSLKRKSSYASMFGDPALVIPGEVSLHRYTLQPPSPTHGNLGTN